MTLTKKGASQLGFRLTVAVIRPQSIDGIVSPLYVFPFGKRRSVVLRIRFRTESQDGNLGYCPEAGHRDERCQNDGGRGVEVEEARDRPYGRGCGRCNPH